MLSAAAVDRNGGGEVSGAERRQITGRQDIDHDYVRQSRYTCLTYLTYLPSPQSPLNPEDPRRQVLGF